MLKMIIFLLVLMFNCLEALPKPYVTCHLMGQLGNQLHQISTTLAYGWDHNVEPLFPELNRTDNNIPLNRSKIFFRLNASVLPRPILYPFNQKNNFVKIPIPFRPDHLLNGYFQTWRYYHHHREKLVKVFAPSGDELHQIQSKHADLLKHPMTVALHVRTFNKAWSKIIPFVGLDYYEQAMSRFPEEALFVVFSDRINWCKHHFKKFNRPMVFIDGQDHVRDLFLMSMLQHQIIGNSSYSWWAAYLNTNPNKIVIAPSHFIHPWVNRVVNANMPDWITLDIDLTAPFPDDVTAYDTMSKSIDTQ